jgi:hypothetical protein
MDEHRGMADALPLGCPSQLGICYGMGCGRWSIVQPEAATSAVGSSQMLSSRSVVSKFSIRTIYDMEIPTPYLIYFIFFSFCFCEDCFVCMPGMFFFFNYFFSLAFCYFRCNCNIYSLLVCRSSSLVNSIIFLINSSFFSGCDISNYFANFCQGKTETMMEQT